MHDLYLTYAVIGAAGLLLAAFSRKIPRLPISEPLVGLLLGVLVGPQLLGLIHLDAQVRDLVLLEGTRLLLAGSVMAAALRFPATELRSIVRPVLLLLLVVMPLAAAAASAAAWMLGLPLALALLAGACLSPTDPVLAASVVSGEPAERDLPTRLRQLLTIESGANDGLALSLVGLALAALLPAEHVRDAVGRLAWEVLGGTLIGILAGLLAGGALNFAERNRAIGGGPRLVYTLLLAVGVLGVARLAGTDGVLAVFVAGLSYNRLVDRSDRDPQDSIDEAVNRYAALPLFLVLGVVLPWQHWVEFGPIAAVFVAAVLLVRRPVFLLALMKPLGLRWQGGAFVGWFGPMGVSALFYLGHSLDKGVDDPRLFAAGSLAVTASVVAFGISASPGRKLYASRAGDTSVKDEQRGLTS